MECSKLQNLQSELFFIMTEGDHTFMHLDIIDKFLCIYSSEINICTIAKLTYKMYRLCCSFKITLNLTFCHFSLTYLHSDSEVIKHG